MILDSVDLYIFRLTICNHIVQKQYQNFYFRKLADIYGQRAQFKKFEYLNVIIISCVNMYKNINDIVRACTLVLK